MAAAGELIRRRIHRHMHARTAALRERLIGQIPKSIVSVTLTPLQNTGIGRGRFPGPAYSVGISYTLRTPSAAIASRSPCGPRASLAARSQYGN
jgi:hypothetical protein